VLSADTIAEKLKIYTYLPNFTCEMADANLAGGKYVVSTYLPIREYKIQSDIFADFFFYYPVCRVRRKTWVIFSCVTYAPQCLERRRPLVPVLCTGMKIFYLLEMVVAVQEGETADAGHDHQLHHRPGFTSLQ
jgi:hypothetical protein